MYGADGTMYLAHGLGGRSDLPIPLWLAAYAGAIAVLSSFFVLAALWKTPRLRGADAGRRLALLQAIADAAALRVALRVLGLVLTAIFLIVAWAGPDDHGRLNPAPTWFYVWFWVGLLPLSLAFGPVWKLVNPIRTLADVAHAVLRIRPRSLPCWLGYWPAVASLLAFLWLELVNDNAASPRTVATFVTAYIAIHLAAGTVFGPAWFSRGDGFEAYSTLIARAALIGRRSDGAVVLRNPLDGLVGMPRTPDPTPLVVVVLGATAFDGLSRTPVWKDLLSGTDRLAYLLWGTAGLAATIAAVMVTYGLAIWFTRRFAGSSRVTRAEFAHSLVPIVIGYTVAHYFSFALFQGQQGILLANDPLARGWDLFGLAGATVDYSALPMITIGVIQTLAIVIGHIAAVTAAHDRAVAVLPNWHTRSGQYPMLAVMVAYTTAGIALIAGA